MTETVKMPLVRWRTEYTLRPVDLSRQWHHLPNLRRLRHGVPIARKSAEELAAFYEQEYRQLYQGSEGPNAKGPGGAGGAGGVRCSNLSGAGLANISRHLDIGCSAGLLLQSVQKTTHCQSAGIRTGAVLPGVRHLGRGCCVVPSLEELRSCDEPRFDLISLAHVWSTSGSGRLPGLAAPGPLTESGRLLVEVPNLYARMTALKPPTWSPSARTPWRRCFRKPALKSKHFSFMDARARS